MIFFDHVSFINENLAGGAFYPIQDSVVIAP